MLEIENGNRFWRNEKDQYHRMYGPAVEKINGSKHWYINGELHREDGPAMECNNGTKCWYMNGKAHRIGGPAIEMFYGDKYWFLNGVQYSEEKYRESW